MADGSLGYEKSFRKEPSVAKPNRTPYSPLSGRTKGVNSAASRDAGLFLFPGTPQAFLSMLNQQSHCFRNYPDPNPFL